ncbi:MAG TPA: hypothetical protein VGU46_09300 [Acidobacteriaceae bacterium]|nr:hypothetical protein [Acidobacteriaceae bacterium]
MNVTLVEYYVPGCVECIGIVTNMVESALPDATVSRMNIVATGNRHCHHVEEKTLQKRMAAGAAPTVTAPAAPPIPSGVLFSEAEVAGLVAGAVEPNGFDHSED